MAQTDYERGWNAAIEAASAVAIKWRDENRDAAAKARKRDRISGISGFESPQMADQLDGAAIECNAIAGAIRELAPQVSS